MNLSFARRGLLDWRVGAVVLSVIAGNIYAPAMNRVFAADQLTYFAEVGGHDSLALGLRHVDYAISRVYWKGDDLLFRPILFTWLAIANRLFSYHHVWWNMANVALHVGVAVALLRLLLAIHPSLLALPAAVLFLVLEPPMELVLWNHLGGYLLACLFLAIGLRSFVRRLDGSTTSNAGFAIAFTLACLSYEAMVPIAAAAALILFVKQRRSNRGGDAALLAAPVALYAVLYSFHALHAPRLGYVDRADGRTPFDLANIGSVLNGIQRMLEAWIRELAMPTALRLWAAPFERFGKNFHIALSEPFQILNLVVVLLGLFVLARTASRARFRQAAPMVLLLTIAIFAYAFIIAFGRSADEVAAITYYSYVFSVLAVPLVYTLVDFGRISPSMMTVAAAVLCAFAAVHAAGTVANVRDVRQANRFASLFLTRVIKFVDAHRSEPGFSFAIEPHPEGVDPIVGLVVGYPSDPGRQVLQRRVTEIIFSPDYADRDPKYLLSASGERVVNRSR
jgi:hypothetical protein